MKILLISGSSRMESSNKRLLDYLTVIQPQNEYVYFDIAQLPLFHAQLIDQSLPESVQEWKQKINENAALVICTPEYLHNLPATIKSALEWIASSGELVQKPTLPITFTPHSPRGEKAMKSLIWSLQALDAKIVTSLSIFHTDIHFSDTNGLIDNGGSVLLKEALQLL